VCRGCQGNVTVRSSQRTSCTSRCCTEASKVFPERQSLFRSPKGILLQPRGDSLGQFRRRQEEQVSAGLYKRLHCNLAAPAKGGDCHAPFLIAWRAGNAIPNCGFDACPDSRIQNSIEVYMETHRIHLVGTAVYLGHAQIKGLSYKTALLNGRWNLGEVGIHIFGALWALPTIGFAAVALALLAGWDWWKPVLVGVTLFSLASQPWIGAMPSWRPLLTWQFWRSFHSAAHGRLVLLRNRRERRSRPDFTLGSLALVANRDARADLTHSQPEI
jgi:hypothetical protein